MKLPENVSDSIKRLNPQLYGPVAGLPDTKCQPAGRRESQDRQLVKSKEGVGFCITIISLRKRLVDEHDNLRTSTKPLVDAITTSLGFASDDNPRLRWEYCQYQTNGTEGTIVRLSLQHINP